MVHCDLKPQNVLLDSDMVAHVADFGMGKFILADKQGYASTEGFLRGSVGYIPPGARTISLYLMFVSLFTTSGLMNHIN